MSKFRIEVIDKDFPYEEITKLYHSSYNEHQNEGRNYLAATQTVENTKRRLEGRNCVLAYDENGELVASICFKLVDKSGDNKRKWYEDEHFAYVDQLAVRPDYRHTNVMLVMVFKAMRLDITRNLDSWMCDTSVMAKELTNAYVNAGFQIVDVLSWETTNYYSYIFRKAVKGKKYPDSYVKKKLFWANIKCRIRYSKSGKRRFF